jgi:hypothetical protein
MQAVMASSEVLQDGGAPGVADEFAHPGSVPFSPWSPDYRADWSYETVFSQAARPAERCSGVSGWRSP